MARAIHIPAAAQEDIGMAKTTKAGGKEALSKKGSEAAKHLQTSKPEKKSNQSKKEAKATVKK